MFFPVVCFIWIVSSGKGSDLRNAMQICCYTGINHMKWISERDSENINSDREGRDLHIVYF
jgi:hypothetical protein